VEISHKYERIIDDKQILYRINVLIDIEILKHSEYAEEYEAQDEEVQLAGCISP
jgi:hypothetical protein